MGWSLLLIFSILTELGLDIYWRIIEPHENKPLGAMVDRSLKRTNVQ